MLSKKDPIIFSNIDQEKFKKAETAVDKLASLGFISQEEAMSILCSLSSGEKVSLVVEIYGMEVELQLEI